MSWKVCLYPFRSILQGNRVNCLLWFSLELPGECQRDVAKEQEKRTDKYRFKDNFIHVAEQNYKKSGSGPSATGLYFLSNHNILHLALVKQYITRENGRNQILLFLCKHHMPRGEQCHPFGCSATSNCLHSAVSAAEDKTYLLCK